ncbi:hypothetical protein KIN20_032001 [Parelaphostrongylus tenuis]|uniref:Uncharacterized protein n=1 Tax=Parelaphostrongylus tenuis TaxID=148309 RepID=A0AAD5R6C2_PARTN|nr:hypothetical protein KIN20_032001 [Parelaphostrongylus tenuis]
MEVLLVRARITRRLTGWQVTGDTGTLDLWHRKYVEIKCCLDEKGSAFFLFKDDSTEDYEVLVGGLERCTDLASATQSKKVDRISSTTKELLKKRVELKLVPYATHLERKFSQRSDMQRRRGLVLRPRLEYRE